MKGLVASLLSVMALGMAPTFAASGPDDLWEVTINMDMPGMPMAMGPQTTQVCVEKGKQEKTVPMDKSCQMLDMKRSGTKTSYRFKCTGEMNMTGSGEVTYAADGSSYQGSMQAKGSSEGHSFDMKQNYTGKRIGNCSAGEQKKKVEAMKAQQQQTMDQMCTPPAGTYELQWQMYEKNQVCAAYRPAMCKRAKQIAQELAGDPAKYADLKPQQERWGEGLKHCGIDPDKIAPPCKQAAAKKNWQFVADYCPREAKAIAAKECAGRDYTGAMASEYAPICVSFAKENVDKSSSAAPEQKKGAKDAAKDSITDQATEKLKGGLKGMFGF